MLSKACSHTSLGASRLRNLQRNLFGHPMRMSFPSRDRAFSWFSGIESRQQCLLPSFSSLLPLGSQAMFTQRCLGDAYRLAVCQTQHRAFSSRRNKKSRQQKGHGILSNEKLIQVLMRGNANARGPDDITVRVVIDEGNPDAKSTVEIVSLTEAIRVSVDRDLDLIGTSLNSDPPVIRATQLSKLIHQKEQALKKTKQNSGGKQKKGFRFRAGIDQHDLDRKIKDMLTQLQKGIECEYTVFSKARVLRKNQNAGMDLVERIQGMVGDLGQLKRAPQINEQGSFIRAIVEPKRS